MRSMCVGVAETGHREFSPCADGMESTFFILAILGFYIVGVGASTTRYGRGINTYAEHVCWRRRDRGIVGLVPVLTG